MAKRAVILFSLQDDENRLQAHLFGLPTFTLSDLIGDSLADLICKEEFNRGLDLVRVRRDGFCITARKRFTDIKVIIEQYGN